MRDAAVIYYRIHARDFIHRTHSFGYVRSSPFTQPCVSHITLFCPTPVPLWKLVDKYTSRYYCQSGDNELAWQTTCTSTSWKPFLLFTDGWLLPAGVWSSDFFFWQAVQKRGGVQRFELLVVSRAQCLELESTMHCVTRLQQPAKISTKN